MRLKTEYKISANSA